MEELGLHFYSMGPEAMLLVESVAGTVDCLLALQHGLEVHGTGVILHQGVLLVKMHLELMSGEGLALWVGVEARKIDRQAMVGGSHSRLALVEAEAELDSRFV